MKTINIAVIGVGWIGKIHCECYRHIESLFNDIKVVLHSVSDINELAAIEAKNRFGFLNYSTDWNEVVNNSEIDVVDICVDNAMHKDIVSAAARAGKQIMCEKPLATCIEDAEKMINDVNKYNVKHMINFNYRKVPAVSYIKQLISHGELGEIYHVKGMFLQDFGFNSPMSWRFKRKNSGGGSIVTMGSHIIDLGRYLIGEYKEVSAVDATFIKTRQDINTGLLDSCDVDDAMTFLAKFDNGALGMFMTSWVSHGRKHHCEVEIYGSKGSVRFNSERLNEIELFIQSNNKLNDGIRDVLIGEGHPYSNLFSLKTGMNIGIKESFMIQLYDFIKSIAEDTVATPNFYDGLIVEKVSKAIITAAEEKRWVNV